VASKANDGSTCTGFAGSAVGSAVGARLTGTFLPPMRPPSVKMFLISVPIPFFLSASVAFACTPARAAAAALAGEEPTYYTRHGGWGESQHAEPFAPTPEEEISKKRGRVPEREWVELPNSKRRCGTDGCIKGDGHLGPHSNDEVATNSITGYSTRHCGMSRE